MKMRVRLLPLALLSSIGVWLDCDARLCDVTMFGAVGDNDTEATSAFVSALAACQQNGTVLVPPGRFLLRPVRLPSHTDLLISPGAVLVAWGGVGWQRGWPNSTTRTCSASPYEAKKPLVLPRLESLLYADAVQNVTVRGGGTIDGQGWRWWPLRAKSEYWHHCRPHLIRVHGSPQAPYDLSSSHLAFDNITLHNSPNFNFHVHARHARWTRIRTSADTCPLNTDSFNVGGHDPYIADSHVHSGDDCVPIGRNTSDVLVERVTCACGNGASPILWDTADDPGAYIRNVTFRNMTFSHTKFAANIKSLGSYRGSVSDVVFENFVLDSVDKAINVNLYGQSATAARRTTPGVHASKLAAIMVANVTFRNFRGTAKTAGTFECDANAPCTGIVMDHVHLTGTDAGYVCKGSVTGTVSGCVPTPCIGSS